MSRPLWLLIGLTAAGLSAGGGTLIWRGRAPAEQYRQQARAALERGDWREVERLARLLDATAGADDALALRAAAYARRGRMGMDELARRGAALDAARGLRLLLGAAVLADGPGNAPAAAARLVPEAPPAGWEAGRPLAVRWQAQRDDILRDL